MSVDRSANFRIEPSSSDRFADQQRPGKRNQRIEFLRTINATKKIIQSFFTSNTCKILTTGMEPCSNGYGRRLMSKGREIKSQHRILDGHFSHLFVVKIVMCVWKRWKYIKRGGSWTILEKQKRISVLTNPCQSSNLSQILCKEPYKSQRRFSTSICQQIYLKKRTHLSKPSF